MKEQKLITAFCAKKKRYFGMEAVCSGGSWQVTNMIELPESQMKMIPNQYAGETLLSAPSLLPCSKCGSRHVAGCTCAENSARCRDGRYHFQCLYCGSLALNQPTMKNPTIYVSSPHYDDIAQVLDSLNLSYQLFNGQFDCELLFINCGTSDDIDPQRLERFVRDGGCVYISDLAISVLDQAFPSVLLHDNDTEACKVRADVNDPELQQIAGDSLEIEFDLGVWAKITDVQGLRSRGGRVLLTVSQGSRYAGSPIMVSFKHGKGTVFYTSFHNHAQASEKEQMLLQLLLLKQIGTTSNRTIEQVGSMMGLNISVMKEKFKK